MNSQDFNKMMSLISKLKVAIEHAKKTDTTFNRYHGSSISFISNLESHLGKIECGLTTANIIKPNGDCKDNPATQTSGDEISLTETRGYVKRSLNLRR